MASSLVVGDPSIPKINARPTGQIELQGLWKSRNFRPILCCGSFYWPVYYHYNYTMAIKRQERNYIVRFRYLWLTCAQNMAWFSLILQRNVTFLISSARAQCVLYEFVLIIKKFGMV